MTVTAVPVHAQPGAIVGVGRLAPRHAVRSPFAVEPRRTVELDEGPLALAMAPDVGRELHVGARTICLLEGTLYEDPVDAAALAAVWEREGERILPGLRGEFWALLWDRERVGGLIVCDQLGTCSPYWTVEDGCVLCASDIPELLAARRRRPTPDPVALSHWMAVTLPPAGSTLYAGVRRLQAGHVLELTTGNARTRRYWSLRYRPPERVSREEIVASVRSGLERAVARRVGDGYERADTGLGRLGVPAVLLSGGLDSGSVAALGRRPRPDLSAYSAVFPRHPDADESALLTRMPGARVVVQRAGVLAGALDYIDAWALPPTSPNMFFWCPLFDQAAADGVTAMLDGEGGDEVFGFSPYLVADRLRRGQVASAIRLVKRWPGWEGRVPRDVLIDRMRAYGLRGALPPAAHLLARRLKSVDAYAPAWLDRRLAREWLDTSLPFDWKHVDGPRWWAYLSNMLTQGIGPAAAFEQARRRAAGSGIQSRHPLVDVDLIELVLGLDPALAFEPRHNRPLLREALAGALPDRVRLRRSKSDFDSVFHEGLALTDVSLARQLLEPGRAELSAYVDLPTLNRQLFDSDAIGSQSWALALWRALTAECWLRAQSDPEVCRRLSREATPAQLSIELVGA